jgi:anti-sigma-K factor RskA
MRDHTFWRDVATRTMSAIFAAILVYLGAVLLGYVSRPAVWPIVLGLSISGAAVSAGVIFARRSKMMGAHHLEGYEVRRDFKVWEQRAAFLRRQKRALIWLAGQLVIMAVSMYQLWSR